ncbi:hypothetical protein N7471_008876 [Penicillium samsonianum]|uniref:uncharacterized protein n=1 Tax=Penicillium samsonianum TaxID=1882272 RepID=UPI0025469E62|nr:uncharacterized protein N7471_008876 [Penicillium samsonianum]KAJ6133661.1 hypothetical protein N7471_008876 [Penicillium samsonianum]
MNVTSVNVHPRPIAVSIGLMAAEAPAEKKDRTKLLAAVATAGLAVCRSTSRVDVDMKPSFCPTPTKIEAPLEPQEAHHTLEPSQTPAQ